MVEYEVKFNYSIDEVDYNVHAYGSDITSYGCDDLSLDFYDKEGNLVIVYDVNVLSEIEEIANDMLFNEKYNKELNFE